MYELRVVSDDLIGFFIVQSFRNALVSIVKLRREVRHTHTHISLLLRASNMLRRASLLADNDSALCHRFSML
jgi:hypothetical protein